MQHIFTFLEQIAQHNDRDWFHAHQPEYKAARTSFEAYVQEMILRIAAFDSSVAYQSPKTSIYRFARKNEPDLYYPTIKACTCYSEEVQ